MFKLVNGGEKLPERATRYSAGFDVFSNEDVTVHAGCTVVIGLGIMIDDLRKYWSEDWGVSFSSWQSSHYFALHVRSSLRAKGITDLGVGIIDIDYCDEIKIVIHNTSQHDDFHIRRGDKIGQLILCEHFGRIIDPTFTKQSDRIGGFGSTGR